MITVITENPRAAKAIAGAFNATPCKVNGIYLRDDLTVIAVPQDFLTPRKLNIETLGRLPYIPSSYTLRQNRGKAPRGFDGTARKAILDSSEIVFASDSGADAQARFDNLRRHFNVGQKTSRMWLTSLRHDDIIGAFGNRTSGRHLHRMAQTGLVSMAMEASFSYNFNNALGMAGFGGLALNRRETIVLDFLRSVDEKADETFRAAPSFRICINPGTPYGMMSTGTWETREEAEKALSGIVFPDMLPAVTEVHADTAAQPALLNTLALQSLAFARLHLYPGRTMNLARSLFSRGLISTPYTFRTSLSPSAARFVERQYPDHGLPVHEGEEGTHGIIVLAKAGKGLGKDEYSLYNLIRRHNNSVLSGHDTVLSGSLTFSAGGVDFIRTLDHAEAKEAADSTGLCGIPFSGAAVREIAPVPAVSYELTHVLRQLMDERAYPGMDFRKEDDDFGSALSTLIGKKLVKECEGMVFLSEKGDDIMDHIGRLNPGANLTMFRYEADGLTYGKGSGRQCIADFGEWLERFTLGMTAGQTVESEYGETACPVCGAKAIYHDRNRIRCAECSYNIADTYMGRRLTPALTRQLLTFLHTSEVKGLRDADGRRFASVLALDADFRPTHVPPGILAPAAPAV